MGLTLVYSIMPSLRCYSSGANPLAMELSKLGIRREGELIESNMSWSTTAKSIVEVLMPYRAYELG